MTPRERYLAMTYRPLTALCARVGALGSTRALEKRGPESDHVPSWPSATPSGRCPSTSAPAGAGARGALR